jgi:hypothetical protein
VKQDKGERRKTERDSQHVEQGKFMFQQFMRSFVGGMCRTGRREYHTTGKLVK